MKKILLGSLLFVGLYNIFFYPTVPGIGIGFFFLVFHLYLFFVRSNKSAQLLFAVILSFFSVFFAFCIGWRANEVIQLLDLMLATFLTFSAGYFYKHETRFSSRIFSFILTPLTVLTAGINSAAAFISENMIKTKAEKYADISGALLRGILIAIPILLALFVLLTGADPIFAKLFSNISFTIGWRLLISLLLFILCFIWGVTKISERLDIDQADLRKLISKGEQVIESLVVSGSAAVLFAIFLFIQLEYLFLQVPEAELYKLGINIQTYSEYTRQGFFQLLIAAAIATTIVAYIAQFVHEVVIKQKVYLQITMLFLTLETEFLLVSAGKRLYLYADAHGLTMSRFFGFIFLVWLSLLLFLLLISTFKKLKRDYFFASFFLTTIAAFLAVNVIPIDRLIAKVYPPTVNKEIDYQYIMSLSSEAAEVWPEYILNAEYEWEDLRNKQRPTDDEYRRILNLKTTLMMINDNLYYLDKKYSLNGSKQLNISSWKAINISELKAYETIRNSRSIFQRINPLLGDIGNQQARWHSQQIKDQEIKQKTSVQEGSYSQQ